MFINLLIILIFPFLNFKSFILIHLQAIVITIFLSTTAFYFIIGVFTFLIRFYFFFFFLPYSSIFLTTLVLLFLSFFLFSRILSVSFY